MSIDLYSLLQLDNLLDDWSNKQSPQFLKTPDKAWRLIFSSLDPKSLRAAYLTCRKWKQILSSDTCWRRVFFKFFHPTNDFNFHSYREATPYHSYWKKNSPLQLLGSFPKTTSFIQIESRRPKQQAHFDDKEIDARKRIARINVGESQVIILSEKIKPILYDLSTGEERFIDNQPLHSWRSVANEVLMIFRNGRFLRLNITDGSIVQVNQTAATDFHVVKAEFEDKTITLFYKSTEDPSPYSFSYINVINTSNNTIDNYTNQEAYELSGFYLLKDKASNYAIVSQKKDCYDYYEYRHLIINRENNQITAEITSIFNCDKWIARFNQFFIYLSRNTLCAYDAQEQQEHHLSIARCLKFEECLQTQIFNDNLFIFVTIGYYEYVGDKESEQTSCYLFNESCCSFDHPSSGIYRNNEKLLLVEDQGFFLFDLKTPNQIDLCSSEHDVLYIPKDERIISAFNADEHFSDEFDTYSSCTVNLKVWNTSNNTIHFEESIPDTRVLHVHSYKQKIYLWLLSPRQIQLMIIEHDNTTKILDYTQVLSGRSTLVNISDAFRKEPEISIKTIENKFFIKYNNKLLILNIENFNMQLVEDCKQFHLQQNCLVIDSKSLFNIFSFSPSTQDTQVDVFKKSDSADKIGAHCSSSTQELPLTIPKDSLISLTPLSQASSSTLPLVDVGPAIKQNAFNQFRNFGYWYQAADLQTIQTVLLPKEGRLLPPLGIDQLEHELERFKGVPDGEWIAGCFNKGANHWVIYALLRDQQTITLLYKDSYGHPPEPSFKEFFNKVFPGIPFIHHATTEQIDGASCGVFALRNLTLFTDQLRNHRENFVNDFVNFKHFCTTEEANQLRREVFPRYYIRGIDQALRQEKTRQAKWAAIQAHHQSELETLQHLLASLPYQIELARGQQAFDRTKLKPNTIGLELGSRGEIDETQYAYCYRLNPSLDISLEILQQQLRELLPSYDAVIEEGIIKIVPESVPGIILKQQQTIFLPPHPPSDEELLDKLEAHSVEQKRYFTVLRNH